jgi:hypothetical protein
MPNTIKIKFTGQDVIAYYGPWQYDYGLVLEIQGLMNLPTLTQVHFARKGSPTAEIRIGTYADGVLAVSIPDIMLAQSAEFWAYVYLTDGESAQTIKGIQFYPNARPEPDDVITPDEQNAVDQLVAELNALIAAVEEVNDTATASAQEASESADEAERSKAIAAQALSDLLAMMGTDIATLTNGKLTPSQIPPLSINDVFEVPDTDAMLALEAQRGDCALIVPDDVVTDSYILAADDPTDIDNWKKLGVSYVANAGHANTADEAVNADKINNKRMVAMTQSQYDTAVIDPDTIYIVTPDGV